MKVLSTVLGTLAVLVGLTLYVYHKRIKSRSKDRYKIWFTSINLLYDTLDTVDELLELRGYIKSTWKEHCMNIDQESRVLNVLIRIDRKLNALA